MHTVSNYNGVLRSLQVSKMCLCKNFILDIICEERVSVFIDRVIKEHKSNSLSSGKCILKLE